MTPTITLGHPNDFSAIVNVVPVPAPGISETAIRVAIAEEGGGLIGNECTCFAVRVDFDYTINLMTALIVLKRERPAVLAPDRIRQFVRIREKRVIDIDLLSRRNVKQHRLFEVEHVARLGVHD